MVVVLLTVGLSIPLKEVHCSQFLVAVAAHEVFRVPSVAQCSDHLPHNWLGTSCTDTLLLGLDTLLVHILLQVAQHVIQIRGSTNHLIVKYLIKIWSSHLD